MIKDISFMKSVFAGVVSVVMFSGAASAGPKPHCTDKPRNEWLTVAEISTKAEALGYKIHEIEREGSCYELEGYDKNGAKIEILLHPITGETVPYKKW